jgi:hypothetical protein
MKAYITKDTKNSKGLWLIIEGDKPADIEGIMGMLRTEDSAGNVAYAIVQEEVEAIRDACDKWLKK